MTRVAAVQLAPDVTDPAGSTARALAALHEAVGAGADLVVLPELTTSGYVFDDAAEAAACALDPAGPELAAWAAACAARPGAVVVGGFCEAGADGRTYNSAAVVDGGGVRAVYRKAHLWDGEKLVFSAGAAAPPVVETAHGRVAVMVCYDLEFPEWVRTAALAGADLLAVPTNWPLGPRPEGERVPEVQVAMAAARVNHLAVACADRTGTERGVDWSEGTTVISADGWPLAAVGAGTGTAWADVDLAASRDKRLTALADPIADRRPHLYGAVTAPALP